MLLLLACTAASDAGDPTADDTAAMVDVVAAATGAGPYHVGYHLGEVQYAAPDGARSLRVAAWYPTEASSGSTPEYNGFLPAGEVFTDVPIATGPFPLVVFSHGHQGFAENSAFLMEHLASHGWAVVAPDHTGNTMFDDATRSTDIYYQRPLDVSAVLDALPALEPLGGNLDDTVVATGHSFGGYTMFALAGGVYDLSSCPSESAFCSTMDDAAAARFTAGFSDPRVTAYVAMAAGDYDLFGAAGLGAIDAPFLQMTATEDQPPGSEGDDIWDALHDGDDLRVIIEGAGHQSFTDFADTFEDVSMDAEDGFVIVDAYVLAWAEQARGNDALAAILDGTLEVSPAAELLR